MATRGRWGRKNCSPSWSCRIVGGLPSKRLPMGCLPTFRNTSQTVAHSDICFRSQLTSPFQKLLLISPGWSKFPFGPLRP